MAIAKKILAAQNEVLELLLIEGRAAKAGVQYPAGGTGTIALEGTIDEITWVAIQVRSAVAEATLATSVAAAGIHYADVSYLKRIRLRKTDVGSTTNPVALSLNYY